MKNYRFKLQNKTIMTNLIYTRMIALLLLVVISLSPTMVYAKNIKFSGGTPKITSLNMFSDNRDTYRAFQGDTVSIMFTLADELDIPISSFEVLFDGQIAQLYPFGQGTYFGDVLIDDISPTIGYGELFIYYVEEDGSKTLLADNSMAGKGIFLSDKSTLIDVLAEDIDISTRVGTPITEAELSSIYNIFDNNTATYSELELSGDGKYVSIIFDFGKEGINLSRMEVLARQDQHYTRVNGTHIQGSNNGTSWTKISNNAGVSDKWQVVNLTKSSKFRYIKITSLSSWYANLAELRLYGKEATTSSVELPKVTEASLISHGQSNNKLLPGDQATLRFKTNREVQNAKYSMTALMMGSYCEISNIDEKTYEASITTPEGLVMNTVSFSLEYVPLSGQSTLLTESTTDGSSLFVSNEENLISLLNGTIDFIDFRGKNTSQTLDQILNLSDNEESTISHFKSGNKGEPAYITFDFRSDGISLSRIELLPRQDSKFKGTDQIKILASNDGDTWTNIASYDLLDQQEWQAAYLWDSAIYRYIRLSSDDPDQLSLAELKLFEREDETAYYTRYVNLGTSGIGNPISYTKGFEQWDGSKVYYGTAKNKDSLLWRVLNKEEDGSLLLFADDVIEAGSKYNHRLIATTWETSIMRCYLNGTVYHGGVDDPGVTFDYTKNNFLDKYFSATEQKAILTSHLTTEVSSNGSPGGNDTDDKLFLLALEDAVNKSYGFTSEGSRANGTGDPTDFWWWLRTVGTTSRGYAAGISQSGSLMAAGYNVSYLYTGGNGVRPAFRLDADSILFTTYFNQDKSKYAMFGSKDSKVESDAYLDGTWKITLKTTKDTLNATPVGSTSFLRNNHMDLTLDHDPASLLSKDAQVSAMLLDEKENVLYYGKLNEDSTATSSKLLLPNTLKAGSYTLKIFAESLNDGASIDYATDCTTIPITIASGIEVEDILGLPESTVVNDTIVLDGYVVPKIASFNKISYYLEDAGETGATLSENVISYEAPGVITVVAIVNNGLLYGRPYVKQFTIEIEDKDGEIPLPDTPEITPPDESGPEQTPPDAVPDEVLPEQSPETLPDASPEVLPEEDKPNVPLPPIGNSFVVNDSDQVPFGQPFVDNMDTYPNIPGGVLVIPPLEDDDQSLPDNMEEAVEEQQKEDSAATSKKPNKKSDFHMIRFFVLVALSCFSLIACTLLFLYKRKS